MYTYIELKITCKSKIVCVDTLLDVPLDRVWVFFFGLSVQNRVFNFVRVCPKLDLNLS